MLVSDEILFPLRLTLKLLLSQIHLATILGVERITLICPWLRACLLCESSVSCHHCPEAEGRPKKWGAVAHPHWLPYPRMDERDSTCSEPGLVPRAYTQGESHTLLSMPGEGVGRVQLLREALVLYSSLTHGCLQAPGPLLKAHCGPFLCEAFLDHPTFRNGLFL